MSSVRIKRGTRAQITSAAAANGLKQGELYHVTDENRVDVGTGTDESSALATKSEVDGKEPTISAGTTAQYWRGDKTWADFATDVRATVLTGLSTATNAVITAADTVLVALGKLQKQFSDHFASTANAHPASAIINTPAGNIAATTVQAAINELDSEKVSKSGDTMTGNLIVEKETGSEVDVAVRGYSVGPVMHGYFSNGTKATPTAVTTGQLLFGIGARPYGGSAYSAHSTAAIHMIATENHSATNQGTSFNILVTPAGTTEANRKYAITYESPSLSGPIYAKALLSGAIGSRYYFQTSEANAGSSLGVIPNGTGANSAFNALATSDVTNYSLGQFRAGTDGGDVRISSLSSGTGALLPIRSYLNSTKNTEQPAAGGFLVTGGAFGYGTGVGGTVNQPASDGLGGTGKTSRVTLNKPCGSITTQASSIPANSSVSFFVANNTVASTDSVLITGYSGGVIDMSRYIIQATNPNSGNGFFISIRNMTGSPLEEVLYIAFVVVKSVQS